MEPYSRQSFHAKYKMRTTALTNKIKSKIIIPSIHHFTSPAIDIECTFISGGPYQALTRPGPQPGQSHQTGFVFSSLGLIFRIVMMLPEPSHGHLVRSTRDFCVGVRSLITTSIRQFKQHIRVAQLIGRTPAGKVLAAQFGYVTGIGADGSEFFICQHVTE